MSVVMLLLVFNKIILPTLAEKVIYDLEKPDEYFKEFIEYYDKSYDCEVEKQRRFDIFKDTLKKLNDQNEKNKHAVFGINEHSDLACDEFIRRYGYLLDSSEDYQCEENSGEDLLTSDAPDVFDWRDQNAVTKVQHQGTCGSCWAFSVVGNVEGQYSIKYNELVEFSKQQLLDCDKRNSGCSGGSMIDAMRTLQEMGGIQTEEEYPYQSEQQECNFDKDKIKVKVKGCVNYTTKDEEDVKEILHKIGPLSIGIDATDITGYRGGILDDCGYTSNNHGVLLVGYGTENNIDYWIIKNSWGENYGEDGYVRVKREINGCGFLNECLASSILG